jgi:hypothetical protein
LAGYRSRGRRADPDDFQGELVLLPPYPRRGELRTAAQYRPRARS